MQGNVYCTVHKLIANYEHKIALLTKIAFRLNNLIIINSESCCRRCVLTELCREERRRRAHVREEAWASS